MLWNGLFRLHKSRKTGLGKTSSLSLSALCRRWSEHPQSEGKWSLEMRWPWFPLRTLGLQRPWWGTRCPSSLPALWLEVTSTQTYSRCPSSAFPGLPCHREPPHTNPLKHPSTFHFMSRETGVGRKKEQWSLAKASHSYGHGVVWFAHGVAHHIAMAPPALWPFSSLLIWQREAISTAEISLYLWNNVTG